MVGAIELKGLFPGFIKLVGEGGTSKAFVIFGELKSSITSLNIIPVDSDRNFAPNLDKRALENNPTYNCSGLWNFYLNCITLFRFS